MAASVHVGDIGTVFIATIVDQNNAIVDVSSASTKQLWFGKPDGTVLQAGAAFTTSGVDGQIQYSAGPGDLNQAGVWTWEGYVVIAAGTFHSEVKSFAVAANIGGRV